MIRHVLVDDDLVVLDLLFSGCWTVFHHRACFGMVPRPRHFPLRNSFNAWRNVAVSAGAAREPEREENCDQDDSHVDTAAISFPEDLQRIYQRVQTELIVTSDALGEILREGQRHRAAMEHVIAGAAARHESFAGAITLSGVAEPESSSSEGLDDAQRHHESVQDALHDTVIAQPAPEESGGGPTSGPSTAQGSAELEELMERVREQYGTEEEENIAASRASRSPEPWRWERCQRCDLRDIDLKRCTECFRRVCQERCWTGFDSRCWPCVPPAAGFRHVPLGEWGPREQEEFTQSVRRIDMDMLYGEHDGPDSDLLTERGARASPVHSARPP